MTWVNQNSIELLKKYMGQSISDSQKISFFILSGPQGIWKSQIAQDLVKQEIWQFFHNDFLHIKDFSDKLWKTHELKVEYKENNPTSKEIFDNYWYEDLWTREINHRLNISPTWKFRVVLIENIERMNASAMNAFLKTCEEPLPNRIILATTSNKSKILDTILSRAIVIPFFECSYDELQDYCNSHSLFKKAPKLKDISCFMSMWKIWVLNRFDEIFSEVEDLRAELANVDPKNEKVIKTLTEKLSQAEELNQQFANIIQILSSDDFSQKYSSLSAIAKKWFIDQFLDWLIFYYVQHGEFENAQKWIEIKKVSSTNIKIDNLLFYALI